MRGRVVAAIADQRFQLVGAAGRHRRRAAHEAEQLGGRDARPFADVGEEVAGRDHRAGGVAHVLRDHRRVVVAAAPEVRGQLVVGERVGIDGLDLAVLARSRPACASSSHSRSCSRHSFPARPRRRARSAAGSPLGDRLHLVVREAVDVPALEPVEEQAVVGLKSLVPRLNGSGCISVQYRVTGRGKCTGSWFQLPGPGASKPWRAVARVRHVSSPLRRWCRSCVPGPGRSLCRDPRGAQGA